MFLAWMDCNKKYEAARELTYAEFPTKFVFKDDDDNDTKTWEPRKQGFSIGRLHSISPKVGEGYYLRILINQVRGPRSFEEIRTVNGQLFPTFRDACYALGLLDDDKEWIEAIKEASSTSTSFYLRSLFATILMSDSMSRPEYVWENTWEDLSEGILYRQRILLDSPGILILF